jgi:formylglycine-generating enzyme required for sulfatase activity
LGIEQLATAGDLRKVMHTVAFAAHDRPPDPGDGRGVLRGSELEGEMSRFLRRLRCDRIDEKLYEFTQALRDETGLLQEIGDDTYMFPHLTFQEYLAACALADSPKLIETAYRAWSGRDGDRWREVLLLMVGRLRQQGTVELQGVPWVRALLAERSPSGAAKTAVQRQRDALLAADCYAEWEGRVALSSFEREEVEQFEQRIARAVVLVLSPKPLATLGDRLRAGQYLSTLGDPRPGVVSLEPDWCVVPAGPFLLGSTDEDEQANSNEKPQRTVDLPGFRISRYPVTNAQWRMFMEAGRYSERQWWSDAGWEAKEPVDWTKLRDWDEASFNGSNQPIVNISWYEATAFCRWLSAELGYEVRLPSEAEWEKAARGTDGRIYPWGNEWDDTKANTAEINIGATTPVGCFPEDTSPYGLVDIAGNVGEWVATVITDGYASHDGTTIKMETVEEHVNRGGRWPSPQMT